MTQQSSAKAEPVQSPSFASPARAMKARQSAKLVKLREALVAAGFDTLSKQASVLELGRSTAWMVLSGNHKSSGLSASLIKRILSSPNLPPLARQVTEEYVQEKLLGAYGHNPARLRLFRAQLGLPTRPLTKGGDR
jgi:hypothetical protein